MEPEVTPDPAVGSGSWHDRLAGTRSGRVVVILVVAVTGFWIVAPNMPASPFRERVDALWAPAVDAGLAQDWGVFTPNPRDQSLDVRARVELADGSVVWWDVPDLDPVLGAYREYRWQKWQERVRLDARRDLWEPTAAWIAERHRVDGELPASVTLVRRWIDHEPLTNDGAVDSDWNEFEYCTWRRDGSGDCALPSATPDEATIGDDDTEQQDDATTTDEGEQQDDATTTDEGDVDDGERPEDG